MLPHFMIGICLHSPNAMCSGLFPQIEACDMMVCSRTLLPVTRPRVAMLGEELLCGWDRALLVLGDPFLPMTLTGRVPEWQMALLIAILVVLMAMPFVVRGSRMQATAQPTSPATVLPMTRTDRFDDLVGLVTMLNLLNEGVPNAFPLGQVPSVNLMWNVLLMVIASGESVLKAIPLVVDVEKTVSVKSVARDTPVTKLSTEFHNKTPS